MFGQETKRYYVLFGYDQCELLVYKGVRDGQPYCRTHTHTLSPDMAVSVVKKVLTIVSPTWTLELEASSEYQATDWAGAVRAVRRLMRAADADYRRKREMQAHRERQIALQKEEADRLRKKADAEEIARKVRELQEPPLHPDELKDRSDNGINADGDMEGTEDPTAPLLASSRPPQLQRAQSVDEGDGPEAGGSRRNTAASSSGVRVEEVELLERHKAVAPPDVLAAQSDDDGGSTAGEQQKRAVCCMLHVVFCVCVCSCVCPCCCHWLARLLQLTTSFFIALCFACVSRQDVKRKEPSQPKATRKAWLLCHLLAQIQIVRFALVSLGFAFAWFERSLLVVFVVFVLSPFFSRLLCFVLFASLLVLLNLEGDDWWR